MSIHDIYVPPEGPLDALVMAVGEGPGREEAKTGRPFVGSAGEQLDDFLRAAGFVRERDIFVTNVTKYLPPKDKDDFFFKGGAPTQVYMEGIIELVKEITEVQPNVIVPMGNYALWGLTQLSGIFKWRGSILESTLAKGKKVIPTIHPAWFSHSRQFNKIPFSEWDWQRVKRESAFPEIRRPNPTLITNPTPEEIEDAIERLLGAEAIATDTEWFTPDDLAYIGFSDSPDWAICIPPTTMQAFRAYSTLLDSNIPKVMQNAMFDVPALSRIGIEVRNVAHDTMIEWWACWGDLEEKGLDDISSVLTDYPYYKTDKEFIGRNDEKGQEYNATDCVVTMECHQKIQNKEFNIAGGRKGYEISMTNMDVFLRAAKMGVLCDTERLDELKTYHLEQADQVEAEIFALAGYPLNIRSSPQVVKFVFDDLGFGKRYKKRTSKQDYLMDIAASERKGERKDALTKIITARRHRNIVSRYLTKETCVDRDGRIRCNWNLAGTRNGRFSTTKPWWPGLPMQTVPEGARSIFIPDPGYIFVGWDYEQAEARYVAIKTSDFDLLDDMAAGIDIHVKLASMLPFGLSYDELMALVAEHGKDQVSERYLAKTCRHAMNYYLTHVGLKRTVNESYIDTGVGIDAPMSKRLHEAYINLHPGLSAWWDEVYRMMLRQKYLENAWGRRRNILGKIYKFDHGHRDGIAFEPQSSVSDLNTLSIADIDKELEYGKRGQVFAHMHDGGFFQVKEEDKDWAVEMVKRCTTREMLVNGEILVIPVEVKVGENWQEMKKVA